MGENDDGYDNNNNNNKRKGLKQATAISTYFKNSEIRIIQ
jgi:hypothetical protein